MHTTPGYWLGGIAPKNVGRCAAQKYAPNSHAKQLRALTLVMLSMCTGLVERVETAKGFVPVLCDILCYLGMRAKVP